MSAHKENSKQGHMVFAVNSVHKNIWNWNSKLVNLQGKMKLLLQVNQY